jgi:hypothetical protein
VWGDHPVAPLPGSEDVRIDATSLCRDSNGVSGQGRVSEHR